MAIRKISSKLQAVIAPSLLAADFCVLKEEVKKVLDGGADWLHVDVMDGHFVPNLSIGVPTVEAIRKHFPAAFMDCHLMVSKPEDWVEPFAKAGASNFTFHVEATANPQKLIEDIRARNMKVGIALKPGTPIDTVIPLAPLVDMVLVMTVEPGFGGQSFMPEMMEKVRTLRDQFPELNIEVDGGVGAKNIEVCAEAGANVIVAGTYVFRHEDVKGAVESLRGPVHSRIHVSDA